MQSTPQRSNPTTIAERIRILRGKRVLLSADLAVLYGVTPKRLSEQFRRNRAKFPADFAFPIEIKELRILRPQIAASSWGGRRSRTIAYTEHGAIMAATMLNSPRAVEMSVYVVRAFVKFRQILASNVDLARKLAALEKSVAALDAGTKQQFEEVYRAIRALMAPAASKSRPIGFTADIDKEP